MIEHLMYGRDEGSGPDGHGAAVLPGFQPGQRAKELKLPERDHARCAASGGRMRRAGSTCLRGCWGAKD